MVKRAVEQHSAGKKLVENGLCRLPISGFTLEEGSQRDRHDVWQLARRTSEARRTLFKIPTLSESDAERFYGNKDYPGGTWPSFATDGRIKDEKEASKERHQQTNPRVAGYPVSASDPTVPATGIRFHQSGF